MFAATAGQYVEVTDVTLNPGDYITVTLVPPCSCNTNWNAMYRGSSGVWIMIMQVDLGSYYTVQADMRVETHSFADHDLTLPVTYTRNAQLYVSIPGQFGDWVLWTRAQFPNTDAGTLDPPYEAHYIAEFYYWYGHSH
jgi:hypothetical protein